MRCSCVRTAVHHHDNSALHHKALCKALCKGPVCDRSLPDLHWDSHSQEKTILITCNPSQTVVRVSHNYISLYLRQPDRVPQGDYLHTRFPSMSWRSTVFVTMAADILPPVTSSQAYHSYSPH